MNRDQFSLKNIGKRARLYPKVQLKRSKFSVLRWLFGKGQEADEWIIVGADKTVELENSKTHARLVLGWDQIRKYTDDAIRGDGFAFLTLDIHVIGDKNGQFSVEPIVPGWTGYVPREATNQRPMFGLVFVVTIAIAILLITQGDDIRKIFWQPSDSPAVTVKPGPDNADVPDKAAPRKEIAEPQAPAPKTVVKNKPTPPPAAEPAPTKNTEPASTKTNRLFADCQYGVMPYVLPPEGQIFFLNTPERGGGLARTLPGKPGGDLKFSNEGDKPAWVYRCELSSYADEVLFNLAVPVRLTFRTPLPVPENPKARRAGEITLDRTLEFSVPKLDPKSSFVFYVWNCCVPKFIQVRLPEEYLVAGDGQKVPLVQSKDNLSQLLMPVPFD